jgi:outer membrane protein assembly factor BamB
MRCRLLAIAGALLAVLLAGPVRGADWPMLRGDGSRSGVTRQELPGKLTLQWMREYPPLVPAWPDQPKMPFDAAYEPVVLGKLLLVGSYHQDGITALDVASGAEVWKFYTDGPVRLAPAGWEDRVFVGSDDGHLYCLEAASGKLLWKYRGGPSDRRILGNGRLISTWPVRGGPAVADGIVYFAAGIWPFMGIFLHAVDARTGAVVWTNDGDGSTFMKQPHNADAFAGVAPQGCLAVIGDRLLVPSGRSVPACYDRKTGKLLHYLLAENSKRGGGTEVAAGGKVYCNGGAAFDLATGKFLGAVGQPVVLTDKVLYGCSSSKVTAYDLETAAVKMVETRDKKGQLVKVAKWSINTLGVAEVGGLTALIQAGSRLFAGTEDRVVAFDLPLTGEKQTGVWEGTITGKPTTLLAAADRLFVVTKEGRIFCFGASPVQAEHHFLKNTPLEGNDGWNLKTAAILQSTGVRDGWCVAWGIGSGRLVTELLRQSQLRVIVIDPDAEKVRRFREQMMAAGVYGDRVAVHAADPLTVALPPYLASLMVSEKLPAADLETRPEFVRQVFQALRPYGGVACLPINSGKRADFARLAAEAGPTQARVREAAGQVLLVRAGPLPGAANWTHEHADAANSRVSRDQLVKAPLGLLWFGGPSHDGILPRHGHGPQPQVIDGRLIIEGIDLVRAMDIYTGRVLWETRLPRVGSFYNNTAHQPGANATGTNFISTSDGIYIVNGASCLRLDPATGRIMSQFQLPLLPGMKEPPRWGYINVSGDYLVGGADPLFDPAVAAAIQAAEKMLSDDDDKVDPVTKLLAKAGRGTNDNLSSSKHLVVMDRHTGQVLWTVSAEAWFRHNAICVGGGRLYAIDRLTGMQADRMKRRGEEVTNKPRLRVLDLVNGKELWSSGADVFGTWLSYSAEHDVLVEAGRAAGDTLSDEAKGMRAYRAATGEVLWKKEHSGPAMLRGDTILMIGKGCDLLTGEPRMRQDPITGQMVEWKWSRTYGCNTPAASEHLLTFRSGAAGYFDLCNDGGTGNFGGFRSSCTHNLVVAGGILTAPDYTRTCTCSYQNQTSLALVPMPEMEMWTFFGASASKAPVQRVGINLGAPGDRRDADGSLWLEYPAVGGPSPAVPIVTAPEKPAYFRRHSSQVEGDRSWVTASGARGLTELTLTLVPEPEGERRYTVRLYFAEPDALQPGQRVFDVALQGDEVLKDFDIVRAAGGPLRGLVREFKGIKVNKDLTITLTPDAQAKISDPILCGIEVVAE